MTLLSIAVVLLGAALAQNSTPPIACNPKAIPEGDRPRYKELTGKLRSAAVGRREMENGWVLRLSSRISLAETAEWISFERRCCPFLTFELSTSGASEQHALRLTGPGAAKQIIESAFR